MTDPDRDDEFEVFLQQRTVLPNTMSDADKLEPPKAVDDSVLKKAREAIHAQQHTDLTQLQPARAARWATPVALAATLMLCLSIVLNVSLNANRPTENVRQMTAARSDKAPAPAASTPAASTPAAPAPSPPVSLQLPSSSPPAPVASEVPAEAQSIEGGIQAKARERQLAQRTERPQPQLASRKTEAPVPNSRDPQAWLREIEALRAQGKTAQADAEMQRFRAAFPHYPAQSAAPAQPADRAK